MDYGPTCEVGYGGKTRKDKLVNDHFYHVFTRSIAQYRIFNNKREMSRFIESLSHYQLKSHERKFSKHIKLQDKINPDNPEKLVDIVAYCIMPTHIHLILKQLSENGISIFMSNVLNSYTRYFNIKHIRKGPLWEGRFKSALIKNNEYLLHLTRYIHLNPTTAFLVNKPHEWKESSYKEYLNTTEQKLTNTDGLFDFDSDTYKKFVEDQLDYQRELGKIKSMILE